MGFIAKVFSRLNISCIKKKEWLGMIKNIIAENTHFNFKWKLVMNEQWMTMGAVVAQESQLIEK